MIRVIASLTEDIHDLLSILNPHYMLRSWMNCRQDPHAAAATIAFQHVNGEDALHQLGYRRQAVQKLPRFNMPEEKSHQISQQPEVVKVVRFGK